MVSAVIFDMDGLMFNTEIMFKYQFREALDKANIHCPDSVIESMIGCDSRQIVKFEQEYPGISEVMSGLQRDRADFFLRYFKEPGSANKPGLQELMTYLEKKKIPYAIASSSARQDILKFIGHAGFEIHATAILSGKDGYASKPNPDIFLGAAKALGKDPEQCLVLEDSKHGIMAAYRAHMQSIFVPDQIVPDEEMKQYIQHTCKDLNEVITYLENA